MIKFKEYLNEAFYSKYVKNPLHYYIVINYIYSGDKDENDEWEDGVTAQGDYVLYGPDGEIKSDYLDIQFDGQGDAYTLFDEYHIRNVVDNEAGYDVKTDMYLEIDKIKYIRKPKKGPATEMNVEAQIIMKEEI